MAIEVTTNHVPRDIVDAWELSADERAEFDYIDWDAIEEGRDSASFFRYKGQLYDLGEFEVWDSLQSPQRAAAGPWDGFSADTYFSGILIRYPREERYNGYQEPDFERVIVARYSVSSDVG